jgi:hypothetical protein
MGQVLAERRDAGGGVGGLWRAGARGEAVEAGAELGVLGPGGEQRLLRRGRLLPGLLEEHRAPGGRRLRVPGLRQRRPFRLRARGR